MRHGLIFVLLLTSATLAFPQKKNLIDNGEVAGPAGWGRTPGADTVTFAVDRKAGKKKPGSLHIANTNATDQAPHNWHQRIDLKKKGRLKFSAAMKAEGLGAGSQARVIVQGWDEAGKKMVSFTGCELIEEDTDWKDVSVVFEVKEDCAYLRVLCFLVGKGKVWFDDLEAGPTRLALTPTDNKSSGKKDSAYQVWARQGAVDLPWQFDPEEAKKLARKKGRPILVYVRCTDDKDHISSAFSSIEAKDVRFGDDGYMKDLLFRAGPFTDRDVAQTIRRRFIPVCATYHLSSQGRGGPLDLEGKRVKDPLAAWGLSSGKVVTPALVAVHPNGKVVRTLHRIGVLSTDLVDQWLRQVLRDVKRRSKAKTAEDIYADGELTRALKLVKGKSDAASLELCARILVREGDLKRAEAFAKKLRGPRRDFMIGKIALRRGDWKKAAKSLEAASKDAELNADARYWAGHARHRLGEWKAAKSHWTKIAGETPYGRKAALSLVSSGPRPWMAESARSWPETKSIPTQTETEAPKAFDPVGSITALLEFQREDGSFGGHQGMLGIGTWDGAITAIALDALAAWRKKAKGDQKKRIDAATKAGHTYLDSWTKRTGRRPDPFNSPYVLSYLVRANEKRLAKQAVRKIAETQEEDGNWTVYHAGRPASFNTAQNIMALIEARAAQIEVADDVIKKGTRALAAMRQAGGLFPYSTADGHEWMTTDHGAIARDPLCEHALIMAKKGSKRTLDKALLRYLEHHDELRVPTKKLYDYFNSRGHGGYFFFFAHKNAVDASRHASKKIRKRVLKAAKNSALAAREGDATFMDHWMIGRAYATAMALLILAEN